MIRYRVGDATAPEGTGPRIICHVVNDLGAWGAGFTAAISRRWPEPERHYRIMAGDAGLKLGMAQLTCVAPALWVVNMVAQHGIGIRSGRLPPIRYNALAVCLDSVRMLAWSYRATVHMPRIGCGLAGGHWTEVEPLVRKAFDGAEPRVEVTVYELPTLTGKPS